MKCTQPRTSTRSVAVIAVPDGSCTVSWLRQHGPPEHRPAGLSPHDSFGTLPQNTECGVRFAVLIALYRSVGVHDTACVTVEVLPSFEPPGSEQPAPTDAAATT